MAFNYSALARPYKPKKIRLLLIGETPPPSGNDYFYNHKTMTKGKGRHGDTRFSATIFYHFFGKLPKTEQEYVKYLKVLKQAGVFVTDITNTPLRVRGSKKNKEKVKACIPWLKSTLKKRDIHVKEDRILFLTARGGYVRMIRRSFPNANIERWYAFRRRSCKTFKFDGKKLVRKESQPTLVI